MFCTIRFTAKANDLVSLEFNLERSGCTFLFGREWSDEPAVLVIFEFFKKIKSNKTFKTVSRDCHIRRVSKFHDFGDQCFVFVTITIQTYLSNLCHETIEGSIRYMYIDDVTVQIQVTTSPCSKYHFNNGAESLIFYQNKNISIDVEEHL